MLNPLTMTFTDLIISNFFLKLKVGEYGVLLDHFIENVDIQGQLLDIFKVFEQLATHRAPHSVPVVQRVQTFGAEGVPTVHENPWNALPDVVLQPTEVAKVEKSSLIVI